MAMVAYQRAIGYATQLPADTPLAGVACTASLASDRPKRGAHRMHAAAQTPALSVSHWLQLVKGLRSRQQEETLASTLLLNLVAEVCQLKQRLELQLHADEQVVSTRSVAPRAWQLLLAGRTEAVLEGEPFEQPPQRQRRAVFPGAFNPRHRGHCRMAQLAAQHLGRPVEFEISILNVDKPPLDFTEMRQRADQFTADRNATAPCLWFTRAATFVEKSRLFPEATFIVGVDTIVRIADPRYYGDDPHARDAILDELARRGCRFLVFGREGDGGFKTLSGIVLPDALRQICQEVPEEDFRHDISSTQLRQPERD
jgi:hypothetical protein